MKVTSNPPALPITNQLSSPPPAKVAQASPEPTKQVVEVPKEAAREITPVLAPQVAVSTPKEVPTVTPQASASPAPLQTPSTSLQPPVKEAAPKKATEAPRPPVKVPYKFSDDSPAKKLVMSNKNKAITPTKRVPLAPIPKQMISKELQARLAAEKLKKDMQAGKKATSPKIPAKQVLTTRIATESPTPNISQPVAPNPLPTVPLDTTPNLAKVLQRLQKPSSRQDASVSNTESLKRSSDSIQSPQTTPEGSPLMATDSPTAKRAKTSNDQENKENLPNQMDTK